MSCSMTTAVIPPVRTIEVTMSMIGAFSRVLTPLVGSSRKRSLGRSAYATATSRSLRSPWASPPASIRAFDSRPNRCSTSPASSSTARSRAARAVSRRVLPSRAKIVSATLSCTVIWSNRLTSWKLRAIPSRMRSWTDWRVSSAPSKTMRPASGRRSPLIRFTSVVFPAPLEPISPNSSPWFTTKSTSSTAWVSPNHFRTRVVSSSAMSGDPPAPGEERREGPHEAGRHRQHQQDQHDAEDHLPVDREPDGVGLEVVEDDGAQHRAEEGAEPAQHHEEDDLAGEGPVEDVRRREPVERHPERPRQAGEGARDHERDPAVLPDLDPDELGAGLVVADRLERLAEGGVHDDPHRPDADEEERQHVVVVAVGEEDELVLARAEGHAPAQERRP